MLLPAHSDGPHPAGIKLLQRLGDGVLGRLQEGNAYMSLKPGRTSPLNSLQTDVPLCH